VFLTTDFGETSGTIIASRPLKKAGQKKFGVEKRDILVKRVKDARESQEEAKDEFKMRS
jgi:hypothetical protein